LLGRVAKATRNAVLFEVRHAVQVVNRMRFNGFAAAHCGETGPRRAHLLNGGGYASVVSRPSLAAKEKTVNGKGQPFSTLCGGEAAN